MSGSFCQCELASCTSCVWAGGQPWTGDARARVTKTSLMQQCFVCAQYAGASIRAVVRALRSKHVPNLMAESSNLRRILFDAVRMRWSQTESFAFSHIYSLQTNESYCGGPWRLCRSLVVEAEQSTSTFFIVRHQHLNAWPSVGWQRPFILVYTHSTSSALKMSST